MGDLIADTSLAIVSRDGKVTSTDYVHPNQKFDIYQLSIRYPQTWKCHTVL